MKREKLIEQLEKLTGKKVILKEDSRLDRYNDPVLMRDRMQDKRPIKVRKKEEKEKREEKNRLIDRYNKYLDMLEELKKERREVMRDMESDPQVIAAAKRGEEPVAYSDLLNSIDNKIEPVRRKLSDLSARIK